MIAGSAVQPSLAEEPWSVAPRHPVVRFAQIPASPRLGVTVSPVSETDATMIVVSVLFQFYRAAISPADGASCGFYPTCSLYGLQALKKKGPFLGAVMTAERILRDHDGKGYAEIRVHGELRRYDPVEANGLGSWPDWPWYSQWPPRAKVAASGE